MKRYFKIFFLILLLSFNFIICSCQGDNEKSMSYTETDITVEMPVKVIVLVVDISKSIKNQINEIIDVLNDEIIDNLKSGDHCVIVPIGDAINVEKAKRFSITDDFEKSDRNAIKEYLYSMKNLLETNHNTDIGAAIKKTFELLNNIKDEINIKNKDKKLDSLVLFITDGEIYPSKKDREENPYLEKIKYDSIDTIFNDPNLAPTNSNYENWWFLGIENDGNHRVDIQNIAERVGAYPERYNTLNDKSKFKEKFKEWILKIDPIKTKNYGKILFSNVRIGNIVLSQDKSKYSIVPNNSNTFKWLMESEKNVVIRFKDVNGLFQDDDTGESIEFTIIPESGQIDLSPGTKRETTANIKLPQISGKGRLKLTINTEINNDSFGYIPEYLFYVNFKSPFIILIHKILPFLIAIFAIVCLVIILKLLKAFRPIKIKLFGGRKYTDSVLMKIHAEIEFGRKTNLDFRIDENTIPLVLGTITRTGINKWKIEPYNETYFDENQKLDHYILGSDIKIFLKDGSRRIIRFEEEK